MNYFGVLERSFTITRRHRVLWIFGFLLALFGAGSSSGNGIQYTFQGGEFPLEQLGVPPSVGVPLILSIVMIALGLAVAAVVINYVCQTALIGLVGEIEEGQQPTVRHGFDVGWSRRALRLFGVDIVLLLPVVLVAIALVVLLVVPFVVFAISGQGEPAPFVFLLLCCLVLLIPLFIAVTIVLNVLRTFSYRQVVLAGDGVFDAIGNGYRLIRANPGQVAAIWLIMFVIGLLWAAVNFLIGLIAIAVVGGPAALVYAIFKSGIVAVLSALPLLGAAILAFAAVNALYTVFSSTVWTLTYRELRGES